MGVCGGASVTQVCSAAVGLNTSTPRRVQVAEADWERDRQGKVALDFRAFFDSWFQLADVWTHTVEVSEYVDFLARMAVVTERPAPGAHARRRLQRRWQHCCADGGPHRAEFDAYWRQYLKRQRAGLDWLRALHAKQREQAAPAQRGGRGQRRRAAVASPAVSDASSTVRVPVRVSVHVAARVSVRVSVRAPARMAVCAER